MRLAGISVSHIYNYNLRDTAVYRSQRVRVQHTQARQVGIAERRKPEQVAAQERDDRRHTSGSAAHESFPSSPPFASVAPRSLGTQNVPSAEINLGPERLNFIKRMAGYPAP